MVKTTSMVNFKVHFPDRDITVRTTPEGQDIAAHMEEVMAKCDAGLIGYELIAAANVPYMELLCGGEVIETITYGQIVTGGDKIISG